MVIYLIRNLINGKGYIGQTKNLIRRWKKHNWLSKNGSPWAIHRALSKYGIDNFEIVVLDRASNQNELDKLEKLYIKVCNTVSPAGYNLTFGGEGCSGNEETRKKISASNMGRIHSEQHKEKIRKAMIGRKFSPETIEKMRQAQLGKKNSEEAKKKIGNANRGRKRSEEVKKRHSILFAWDKNPAFKHDIPNDTIKELRTQGSSISDVAKKLNAPKQLIYRRCKKMGLVRLHA